MAQGDTYTVFLEIRAEQTSGTDDPSWEEVGKLLVNRIGGQMLSGSGSYLEIRAEVDTTDTEEEVG